MDEVLPVAGTPAPEVIENPNLVFEEGLEALIRHQDGGYANAFLGKTTEAGWTFENQEFLDVLDRLQVTHPAKSLPAKFAVTLEFSPIALFRSWIFTVSNKRFLKPSEKNHEFEKKYYLFLYEDFVAFQPLTTNIAHEAFLVIVFERKQMADHLSEFRTEVGTDRKLVLYKDFLQRKVSTVTLPPTAPIGRPLRMKISTTKEGRSLKFRAFIEGCREVIVHSLKIERSDESPVDVPEKPVRASDKMKAAERRDAEERASRAAARDEAVKPSKSSKVEKSEKAEKSKSVKKAASEAVAKKTAAKTAPAPGKSAPVKKSAFKAAPKADAKSAKTDAGARSMEEYRREVVQMLQAGHGTKKKTNPYGNIALGRINKIPVLINLASKYRDLTVRLHFTKNGEMAVFDAKDVVIKTFLVAKNPKSNWLEKKS